MAKDSDAGYHGSDRDTAARVKDAAMCYIRRRRNCAQIHHELLAAAGLSGIIRRYDGSDIVILMLMWCHLYAEPAKPLLCGHINP